MRLRADWLSRVLSVPYMPVLGPVHPDQFTAEMFTDMFADVLSSTRTGATLSFDKDRRWSNHKTDTVLVDEIHHGPEHTIIPVLVRRNGGTVKTFYYGPEPDMESLRAGTRRCRTAYGATYGRVVWFNPGATVDAEHTRLLLKEFTDHEPDPHDAVGLVRDLDDCAPEIVATFESFAHAMADHGFDFLRQCRTTGKCDGPILLSQVGGRVAGAIGPLTVMADRIGAQRLLPQYFGVLPDQRGGGHGRALWRAALRWGSRHGADYQLLQTRVGHASDRLFLSEGLRSLGTAATVAA